MLNNKEYLWTNMEQKIPGIKEMFEDYVVTLIISNHPGAFVAVNSDPKQKVIKCHLYSSISNKILTFYCNVRDNEMYVRNKVNSNGRLITSSDKIKVNSIYNLQQLLLESVINYK